MSAHASDFAALLARVEDTYAAVQDMRQRQEGLQSVPRACADYEELLREEIRLVETLKQERLKLNTHRLSADDEDPAADIDRVVLRTQRAAWLGRSLAHRSLSQEQLAGDGKPDTREQALAARSKVKKLVNRWAFAWHLGSDLLGQLNRIADDVDRPLGEALALLDWSIFQNPASSHETQSAHRARLEEWGAALLEYRDRLGGEIDTLEIRWRDWLEIWKLWCARDDSAASRQEWEGFIAGRRAALQDEARQLVLEMEPDAEVTRS